MVVLFKNIGHTSENSSKSGSQFLIWVLVEDLFLDLSAASCGSRLFVVFRG